MATMQPTTTGPRSGGSRFFASPPRTSRISYRRQNSRPAKRSAAQKTAPGIFLRTTPKTCPANLPQVTETHQENSVTVVTIALGCAVAPNNAGTGLGSLLLGTAREMGNGLWQGTKQDAALVNKYVLQPVNQIFDAATELVGLAGDQLAPGFGDFAKRGVLPASFLIGVGEERMVVGAAESLANPWVMGTYREMQALTAGERGALQAHHILEERHLLSWGLNASEAPAVMLSRQEHIMVTGLLRQELPYGGIYSREAVWNGYQKVYSQAPEWLDSISIYFKKP